MAFDLKKLQDDRTCVLQVDATKIFHVSQNSRRSGHQEGCDVVARFLAQLLTKLLHSNRADRLTNNNPYGTFILYLYTMFRYD